MRRPAAARAKAGRSDAEDYMTLQTASSAARAAVAQPARRFRPARQLAANLALLPAWLVVVFAYVGTIAWTVRISFTSSKVLPTYDFIGLRQYERLLGTERWIVSVENIAIFGVLFIAFCLILGF